MKTLTEGQFLSWAEQHGIVLDERYPESAVLSFRGRDEDARFWCVPDEPERRPYFIASLLELMGNWELCRAWRHLGSWPESADSRRINDVVELRILTSLGLPLGTTDVVEFARGEIDSLLTLLFSTTIFGWSVGEDLYVVPDHGRHLLKTDHHGVIHVSYSNPQEIDAWVSEMANRGFALPEELPDATFKQQTWMTKKIN